MNLENVSIRKQKSAKATVAPYHLEATAHYDGESIENIFVNACTQDEGEEKIGVGSLTMYAGGDLQYSFKIGTSAEEKAIVMPLLDQAAQLIVEG